MLGIAGDGGHGAVGGMQLPPGSASIEDRHVDPGDQTPARELCPTRTLADAPDVAISQNANGERSRFAAARTENPGLPDPALSNGEPTVSLECAVVDPELNPNDHVQNLSVPLAHSAAIDPQHVNAMPDHDDLWYEDEDESPHDDFGALDLAAPLLAAIHNESEAPPRPVAQFQLIPYQLSGLAMYVPLPPASPLRQFVLSNKRIPGRQPRSRDQPGDESGNPPGREPIEPL